jgi:hypothetical protein
MFRRTLAPIMDLITERLKQKLIRFEDEGKYIVYLPQNKRRNYENPEEKVQAETFLKLVLIYKYLAKRILQFVPVQMGSETKEAGFIMGKAKAEGKDVANMLLFLDESVAEDKDKFVGFNLRGIKHLRFSKPEVEFAPRVEGKSGALFQTQNLSCYGHLVNPRRLARRMRT